MEPKAYADRQDLLGLALDIHMAYTGSFPDLSDDDLNHAVRFINNRLETWTKSDKRTRLFDSAVYALLAVAVHEGIFTLDHRAAWKASR